MDREPERKHFFISYNSADTGWAEWIAWVLEEAGFFVHLQAWNFRPGNNFVHEMQAGATLAERTIALLSPGYLASRFTAAEWYAAFRRDPTGEKRLLIPFLVQKCDPTGLLGPIVFCDLSGEESEAHARDLVLGAVRQGSGKPAEKPAFPGVPAKRARGSDPRFPAHEPKFWNLPLRRNPNFTGRDDLLNTVRDSLRHGGRFAVTALSGLGGIGKTQTALEYAYRFASDYDFVWWVRADSSVTLMEDLRALARDAGLEPDEIDSAEKKDVDEAVLAQLRPWLAQRRWLLVLDNAVEETATITWLLHGLGTDGHVLITSRAPNWRGLGSVVKVPRLAQEEAARFLLIRCGRTEESGYFEAAQVLAGELDGLPLALEQAAAYMEEHGKTPVEYLPLYHKHRLKLLNLGRVGGDQHTVATTWGVSLEAIRRVKPTAIKLMDVLALFPLDKISLALVRKHAWDLSPDLAAAAEDDLEWEEVVGALYRHSLITPLDHGSVAVHRLLQEVVRAGMVSGYADRLLNILRRIFVGEFPNILRDRLVVEKGLHDLSRNAGLASFPLIGFHTSSVSTDFVAFRLGDRLTESQIVSLRDEFFDAVQHVSREFGLRPRGQNPNGLLAFVFEEGCPESMARFIRKQTRISHRASTGAVTVSWAIDLQHLRIHTHENPVSVFPPVIVMPQTVFPGLGWLESILGEIPGDPSQDGASCAEPAALPSPVSRPSADRIRILFLGANSTQAPLDLEREGSRIVQELRMAPERDALELRQVWAVTGDTLIQAMLDAPPTIVHFAGYGGTEGIFLRDKTGNPRRVTGDVLASLFALFQDTVKCVVLNACWSEEQAHAIRRHVPHVIGTRAEIPDVAAMAFSVGFYKAIGAGKDVAFAFEAGKARVHMEGYGGEDLLGLL